MCEACAIGAAVECAAMMICARSGDPSNGCGAFERVRVLSGSGKIGGGEGGGWRGGLVDCRTGGMNYRDGYSLAHRGKRRGGGGGRGGACEGLGANLTRSL